MAPLLTTQGQAVHAGHALRDERFVASYLGLSVQTLRTWRKQRRGPRYHKLGRCVRYRLSDLFEFIESQPSGGGGDAKTSAPVVRRSGLEV